MTQQYWWLFTAPRTTTQPSQRTRRWAVKIEALNDEMKTAGVRVFAGGLTGKQREVAAVAASR
jgi:hypothetical protein